MTSALSGTAQAAALQCSVDYKKNDWGSGFSASVTITNRGSESIDDWTLTYDYSGNQKLLQGWNGQWSQSGKTITVKSPQYSTKIAAGAAVTAGANFSYSGTNADPTAFHLNGTRCGGALAAPVAVDASLEAALPSGDEDDDDDAGRLVTTLRRWMAERARR